MEAIGDVRFSRAVGSVREVLVGLAYHANHETRLAYASNELLARWTLRLDKRSGDLRPLSDRQIQRALKTLERTGEIRRVSDGTARRVYRVDPIAGHQLTLQEEAALRHLRVAETALDVATPPDIQATPGDIQAQNGATSSAPGATPTRARVGTAEPTAGTNGTQNDPLTPPKGGNLPFGFRTGQGETATRRRRRKDRGVQVPEVAVVQCPLAGATPQRRAELRDRWLAFTAALRDLDGGQGAANSLWLAWQMYAAGSHAHDAGERQLTVGCNPRTLAWVRDRYGLVLNQAIGGTVVLEPCREQIGGGA